MRKFILLVLCLFRPIFADSPLDGISEFGWDLFQAASNDKNILFSPYSIYSGMAMTAAGAQGDTLKEMQKILNLPSNLKDLAHALSSNNKLLQNHLKIANSLWIAPQFPILSPFRKTIENDFQASVQSIDFSQSTAVNTINKWIAQNTDQKITNLLSPNDIQGATRLVLTNALYFSGKFLKPFNPKLTTPQAFWVDTQSNQQTDMMDQTAMFSYGEDNSFQTVVLPLEGTQAALIIFLPKQKVFTGLASTLTSDDFQSTLGNLSVQKVHVKLPKFTLQQRLDLNQLLTQMGLSTAFTPNANFSGIDGKRDLYLSKVLHEAFFAVDENGIIAAAATAASINILATPQPPVEFIADHPFIFALVDMQTKIPLFLGELASPP
jgi:serpin B